MYIYIYECTHRIGEHVEELAVLGDVGREDGRLLAEGGLRQVGVDVLHNRKHTHTSR